MSSYLRSRAGGARPFSKHVNAAGSGNISARHLAAVAALFRHLPDVCSGSFSKSQIDEDNDHDRPNERIRPPY